jgi:hypothetical protein
MRRPFSAYFIAGSKQKSAGTRSGKYGGCFSIVTLIFARKSFTETGRCAGHCLKEKATIGFPFFVAFPSDRIPKTTKNANVYFLTPSKLYIEFWELLKLLFKNYSISSAFPPDVQCIGSALEVRPRKDEYVSTFW